MRFKRPVLPSVVLSMSLMLILGACMMMTGSGGTDTLGPAAFATVTAKDKKADKLPLVYCGAAAPFYWSKDDTPGTIRQAKIHNAKWKALCGSQIANSAERSGA